MPRIHGTKDSGRNSSYQPEPKRSEFWWLMKSFFVEAALMWLALFIMLLPALVVFLIWKVTR